MLADPRSEPLLSRCLDWPLGLRRLNESLRELRPFEAPAVWAAKEAALHDYFAHTGRSTAVVVWADDTPCRLVLALLAAVRDQPNSPLARVFALVTQTREPGAPTDSEKTGSEAFARAWGVKTVGIQKPSPPCLRGEEAGSGANSLSADVWGAVWLDAAARALAVQHGGAWVGHATRDESAYLGTGDLASAVDLQPIADLHRSEIRALSEWKEIPVSAADPPFVLSETGVDADFVETYLAWKTLDIDERAAHWGNLDAGSRARFVEWAEAIEAFHRRHALRFRGGSGALKLDVLDRAVPGGAAPAVYDPHRNPTAVMEASPVWPGPIALPVSPRQPWFAPLGAWKTQPIPEGPSGLGGRPWVRHWSGVLTEEGFRNLSQALSAHAGVPAGRDGKWDPLLAEADIHSDRVTALEEASSAALWHLLRRLLPPFRVFPEHPDTDAQGWRVWRPVGVNPVWRFARYRPGSCLVPHYDPPFAESARRKTLSTAVIYLDCWGEGGVLGFLDDPQRNQPWSERKWRDRPGDPAQRWYTVKPQAGDLVIFDHRLLHESTPLESGAHKTLVRTDIVWEAVGPAPLTPDEALPPIKRSGAYGAPVYERKGM